MQACFLSFIVPVYNAETYLRDCLDSLLAQDISDYEILCINDGSRDASPAILDAYAAKHPNITVIHKENGGVTTARNRGMEEAKGEYIWFVDSDDLVKPNILLALQNLAAETNCDRVVIGGYTFNDTFTEEEKALSLEKKLPINSSGGDAVVWRSLIRRDFLLNHNLKFHYPDLTHGEDGLFMYELVAQHPHDVIVDEALYFYRVHSGSADTADSTKSLQKKLRSYIRVAQIMQDYYRDRKDARTANTLMFYLWLSLLTTASLPVRESRDALKQLKTLGMYPCRRPVECTFTRSYMTDRTDLIGKIYDKLFLNLHRPWGFAGMFVIRQLIRMKRKIK